MAEIFLNKGRVGNATEALWLAIEEMKRVRREFTEGINDKLNGGRFVGDTADMFGLAVGKVDQAITDMTRILQNAPDVLNQMAQIIDHADKSGAGMY